MVRQHADTQDWEMAGEMQNLLLCLQPRQGNADRNAMHTHGSDFCTWFPQWVIYSYTQGREKRGTLCLRAESGSEWACLPARNGLSSPVWHWKTVLGHSHIETQQAPGGVGPETYFLGQIHKLSLRKLSVTSPWKNQARTHLVSNSPVPLTPPSLFPSPFLAPELRLAWSCPKSSQQAKLP